MSPNVAAYNALLKAVRNSKPAPLEEEEVVVVVEEEILKGKRRTRKHQRISTATLLVELYM